MTTSTKPRLESFEKLLSQYVPADGLAEVRLIFYGKELQALDISSEAEKLAIKHDFDIQSYKFDARAEQLRTPRIVRVGIIQNHIVLPTSEPLEAQKNAIHERIAAIVKAAALCGVNVLCFQEAWPAIPFLLLHSRKGTLVRIGRVG
jgi:beta-ureidopropionase